jgi:hypothetical protein
MDRPSSSDRPLQGGRSPNTFDFNSKGASLAATLTLPQDVHDNVPVASAPPTASDRRSSKTRWAKATPRLRELRPVILTYCISLVFAILYCWFIIVVLIHRRVETPLGVFWDASKTNLVVSILSQISAYLTDATLKSLLGVLRTVFLTGTGGSSFASYVGLGEASGFLPCFKWRR